ncbi:MAG: hypothetical protein R3B13_13570 [Polyangiaceae bacterium]
MRILLVDRDLGDLTRVHSALRELGHDVVTAKTEREASQRLSAGLPEVVLVDGKLPPADTLSFVKEVRSRSADHYVYVYLLNRALPEAHLEAAYLAGCDGEIPKPTTLAQLRSRLLVAERLLPRLGVGASKSAEAAAPDASAPAQEASGARSLAEAPADSPLAAVTSSNVWRSTPHEFQNVAGTFLMLPVSASHTDADLSGLRVTAGIVLSNPELQLEMRVALGVDAASAEALTVHLFGEDSAELEGDMLGELANMFMGGLKDGFSRESLAFTGGLPENFEPGAFLDYTKNCQIVEGFVLVAEGARIAIRVGVSSKKNQSVGAAGLREGMVLAKDVFNARGMLLVTAGTRLSSTMADRLRQALPAKQTVEVAPGVG